jgi:hypothetical protein
MRPRYEGGTYWFGVLMPGAKKDEFMANYNAYWIFRGLRGKMVETKVEATPKEALPHVKVLASAADGGQASGAASVTVSLKPCDAAAFTWTRE